MKSKGILTLGLCGALLLSGCGLSKTANGTMIGTAAGALAGAVIGHYTGNTAVGAAVGGAVGMGAGALIGKKMDQAAEAAAAVEGAAVETVKDANGLDAVKVTFDSGILFATNKSNLSKEAKASLSKFAGVLKNFEDADVAIYGHTDNTGTLEVNQRISMQRAEAVANYLKGEGVAETQIKDVLGKDYQEPVADNATAEGRAQNRRVEVYLYASEAMIKAAEAGTLE